MNTIGDKQRQIRKESLYREIRNLEAEVRAIRQNDPDSSESDPEIQAYRNVIAQKKHEYEIM